MSKEIFEQLKALTEEYTLVYGWGNFEKNDDGNFWLVDFNETSFIVKAGCQSDDLIIETFTGGEYIHPINEEGFYEFNALLRYTPPQIGNYPPPNIECEKYLEVEYIEYELIG